MGSTTARPVPSCPTCCVPQVDLRGLAGNLEGCCVLLEHGGDINLAGDREGVTQVTQAAVGGRDGGDPSEDRTGHREGSGEWEMVVPPWAGVVGMILLPYPRALRSLTDAPVGIRDRGSGVSVAAPLPCTP